MTERAALELDTLTIRIPIRLIRESFTGHAYPAPTQLHLIRQT